MIEMNFYPSKEYKYVSETLGIDKNKYPEFAVCYLEGAFGVGKSYYLELAVDSWKKKNYFDFVTVFRDYPFLISYADLQLYILGSMRDMENNTPTIMANETGFLADKIYEVLEVIRAKSPEEAHILEKGVKPRSHFETPSNKDEFEATANELFAKKSEKLVFTDCLRFCAEAFVIDWARSVFGEELFLESNDDLFTAIEPSKAMFVFEDFYANNIGLPRLIAEIGKIIEHQKWGELLYYDCNKALADKFISNYLKPKFIFSGRLPIEDDETALLSKVYKANFIEISLEGFLRTEVASILEEADINSERYFDNMFMISNGNPFIFNHLLQIAKKGEELDSEPLIFQEIVDFIFRFYQPDDRELLLKLCFFDEISINLLKVLGLNTKGVEAAFNFVSKLSDLMLPSDIKGIVYLDHLVRETVKRYFKLNDEEFYNHLTERAIVAHNLKVEAAALTLAEFEILRNLAFFNCFDDRFALENAFFEAAPLAKKMLENHPKMFIVDKFTWKLDYKLREKLDEFNKYADADKFEPKFKFVEDIWQRYVAELSKRNQKNEQEIEQIIVDMENVEKDCDKLKKSLNIYKKDVVDNENKYNRLTATLTPYVPKKNDKNLRWVLVAGLVFLIISLFSEVASFNAHTDDDSFSLAFWTLLPAIGCFIVSGKYITRLLTRTANRVEIEKTLNEIEKSEKLKIELDTKIKQTAADIAAKQSKLKEQKKDIDRINLLIHENKLKLNQEFVR